MQIPPDFNQQINELERRKQVAESLRGILTVLNSNLSLDDILDFIVRQACPLLNANAVAIFCLHENNYLTIQAAVGLDKHYIISANIPLGMFATGRAALDRRPVSIPDLLKAAANTPPALISVLDGLAPEFKAVLSIPLVIRDTTYGAMTLYYDHVYDPPQEDIDLASSFCNQAALAIENSHLRAQVEEDAVRAERTRLARELHDSVTQMLFSASLISEVLPTIWTRNPEEAAKGLNEVRILTRGALAEMRSLLLELRPTSLEETRLEELLRQLSESISARLRIPVELKLSGKVNVPGDVRIAFYRIAQEAMNNISKHADAHNINLTLTALPESPISGSQSLEMTIADDGCGFEQTNISADHLGLSIMKERAQNIGASVEIGSQENCGTVIQVNWVVPN